MGEVDTMRTPPRPSPAEAPSPVAAPLSHHRDSSQSTSSFVQSEDNVYAVEGNVDLTDNVRKANPGCSQSPLGQTSSVYQFPPPTQKETLGPWLGPEEDHAPNLPTLKDLRRQMEELLFYQQMQHSQKQSSSVTQESLPSQDSIPFSPHECTRKRRISNVLSPQVALTSTGAPDSAGSSATIRCLNSQTTPDNIAERTPSYPFPEMPAQSSMKPKFFPPIDNGSFKLTLPTEKLKGHVAPSKVAGGLTASTLPIASNPAFLPPDCKPVAEDPAYPSPNLYELTLRLNADPGLDSWWDNVVRILRKHYGAERASLAVPGDSTDLENVPWGQKAVFNDSILANPPSRPSPIELATTGNKVHSQTEKPKPKSSPANLVNGVAASAPCVRPPLLARHSFAGFGKERKKSTWNDADVVQGSKIPANPENPRVQTPIEPPMIAETDPSWDPLISSQFGHRQAVFPTPRALEVEADPLIKRTGVVKLFGRTKPVILTREYSQSLASKQSHPEPVQTPEDKVQVTPITEPCHKPAQRAVLNARSRSISNPAVPNILAERIPSMEFFDEYEQVPPSPWSQSPAPSPAPRAHADQNPFFTSHAVDESAFSKHPPVHDYSNLHPLEAIGVDLAKSVVHIPLLHSGPSPQSASSPLRFPVAIISILSPIIPYPSNLRQSLAYLMPHLTTSFRLAQQYSQLERQFASRLEAPRFGNLLGLGGTFSDESSELELVAGLSGHVSYTIAEDGSLSTRASLSSPDEKTNPIRFSPTVSAFGTPALDLTSAGAGGATYLESPGSSARPGNESVDSYFNVPQPKGFREALTQHRNRLSKVKQTIASPSPSSPGKGWTRPLEEETATPDLGATVASPATESRPQPVISPTHASSRHPSTNSFYAQLQRELPRPFTDTVAQLMLNSVPLHLFLAKPQSGEVVWTNSKFDAYRRSQPQEQRLRDPWQNIHSSERDHVAEEWANALRTGSQFTDRVRVRRFNDESAYRWFIFRANPLLSSTGEVLYWIGSFLDIHEQHIAELKAAQEREKFATDAKYRAFSNSVPQVVFEATEYRGLIFVNEQWHLYTGQNLEESLNFGFAKHVHHDDLEKCGLLSLYLAESQKGAATAPFSEITPEPKPKASPQEKHFNYGVTPALDELVRRGVASVQQDENGRVFYSTEIRLRSKGGDFRWHLVRLARVEISSFGSGEASWYGTCTDINDRKNLERELNKAMQQLNSQMESKTKFFSNMSHEIRTPLNGILGTIPFILDTQLDTDQRRMLDTIQNSSTNLRELVDNILDVSRVEAGKMSLVNSWFHVRSVIEDVIDTVSSRAIDKGLEMNYLMDVDVPQMVIGDRFRIRQVLINLIGNAVKFTAQGEIHIHCSIHHVASPLPKPTELLLNFDVVDTGKGFSTRDANRLMQRFSQLGQNASQQNAGSGLGLFLSKQLVEMHGGKLTPSSKEGQGAKFSFYVKIDAPPPPSPDEPQPVQEAHGLLSKATSLQKLLFASKDSPDHKTSEVADISVALESPPLSPPPSSSDLSARFASSDLFEPPSESSALPTPNLLNVDPLAKIDASKPVSDPLDASIPPVTSTATGTEVGSGSQPYDSYSILLLCPMDNTRNAITQHVEQVVPHEILFSITSLPDVEDWKDSMHGDSTSNTTHLVLNLPVVDDVLEVVNYIADCEPDKAPVLVIISDLYQKRQISSKIKELSSSGKRVYTVPKPVKPSAFSPIFDPNNRRDLSKDRNQDMAREINNNFKTMSKMVKEVIGNKGYRVLLVEDDETNRMVMLKYLDKIKVMAETAANGQECTEMVFSKEPGYYSLIICDIQMPVKNGYETCREIRLWELKNHYPQIPIMALSANAMSDQIEDAARAGFNDYVTKPIKHNELGKMMMGLLDPSRPLLLLRDRLKAENKDTRRED